MPRTNGQILQEALEGAVQEGEKPYAAVRAALMELDIFGDARAGERELRILLSGLDSFATRLERFSNGANILASKAHAAIR